MSEKEREKKKSEICITCQFYAEAAKVRNQNVLFENCREHKGKGK